MSEETIRRVRLRITSEGTQTTVMDLDSGKELRCFSFKYEHPSADTFPLVTITVPVDEIEMQLDPVDARITETETDPE